MTWSVDVVQHLSCRSEPEFVTCNKRPSTGYLQIEYCIVQEPKIRNLSIAAQVSMLLWLSSPITVSCGRLTGYVHFSDKRMLVFA